jgi:hypothetical protein
MPVMRAKLRVNNVEKFNGGNERLTMNAVGPNGSYPADGSDEDNTYAHFSPSAEFTIYIANPVLYGKFNVGDAYYVDFTKADPA